jgi:hypothetical protein
MIVSDLKKFIFLDVPRTGTHTVQNILQHVGWRSAQAPHAAHLTPEQILRDPNVGYKRWMNYMKLCFVRNPWDRYVSSYLFLNWLHVQWGLPIYEDFKEYVESGGYEGMHQGEFFFCHGKEIGMTFVGRFEYFERDMKKLLNMFDIAIPSELRHYNFFYTENRKPYTEYYIEEEWIDAVAKRESFIIDKFGYKFGEDGKETF